MNLFLEKITYLTIQELKETFDIFESETNENIKIRIRKAEKVIDSIIGEYGEKLNETQKTIFPTKNDGLPLEIKQATALITKCIFENRNKIISSRAVKSETKTEKRRGNQISVGVTYEDGTTDKYKEIHPCMTFEIYNLLKKYLGNNKDVSGNSFFRS